MSQNTTSKNVVQRIPLPWAISIVCVISLPFALFLGRFNLPVWVSFIVWAEYFALGPSPSNWRLIIPSLPFGALFGALWILTGVALAGLNLSLFVGLAIGALVWVTIMVYLMPKSKSLTAGTLAVFNGLTLFLAVYFTGSIPALGLGTNPYTIIFATLIWTVLAAWLGWFFGWLTITLTFPKRI